MVYEDDDFPSGLSYNDEDSLLLANKGVRAASIIDQKIGGANYKMFLQPVAFANNTWIVAGLHSSEKYNAEKRSLPSAFVLLLMVIAMGIFLFIPLLKIFNLSNNDRLRIIDVIGLVIVIKLLMSLLFFCFFKFYTSQEQSTNSEQILATKIDSAFKNEVKSAYKYLDSFDVLSRNNNILQNYIGGLGGDTINVGNILTRPLIH